MKQAVLDLPNLISSIYDAAFDPARWPDTLAKITDAVGGAQVIMGMHDFESHTLKAIAPRMDPAHMESYATHWGASDILWQRTNHVPVGKVLLAERFVAREELVKTDIYNEWYRPMQLGAAGLGVNLRIENGVPAVCGIKRLVGDSEFSGNDIAIFTALVPHLMRATEVHHRLWDLNFREAFAQTEVDCRRHGVIVVDARGHIAFANEIATQQMQVPESFCLDAGALSLVERDAARELRRFIRRCAFPSDVHDGGAGGSLLLQRPNNSPLHIMVTPFPERQQSMSSLWHIPGPPVAILLISDPERARKDQKIQLQNHFSLTSAEADLAIEILKGDGREAAAARLGIAPGTARIHLQRVFHKAGVHRQAELLRTVSDLFGS